MVTALEIFQNFFITRKKGGSEPLTGVGDQVGAGYPAVLVDGLVVAGVGVAVDVFA
jgi:hypothetical protein